MAVGFVDNGKMVPCTEPLDQVKQDITDIKSKLSSNFTYDESNKKLVISAPTDVVNYDESQKVININI